MCTGALQARRLLPHGRHSPASSLPLNSQCAQPRDGRRSTHLLFTTMQSPGQEEPSSRWRGSRRKRPAPASISIWLPHREDGVSRGLAGLLWPLSLAGFAPTRSFQLKRYGFWVGQPGFSFMVTGCQSWPSQAHSCPHPGPFKVGLAPQLTCPSGGLEARASRTCLRGLHSDCFPSGTALALGLAANLPVEHHMLGHGREACDRLARITFRQLRRGSVL